MVRQLHHQRVVGRDDGEHVALVDEAPEQGHHHLRRLVHERDVLAVVATHDPLMMELADHLVELRDGEVVSDVRREAAAPS